MHKSFLLSLSLFLTLSIQAQFTTGAEQINRYLPFLRDKQVSLVINQTSRIGETLLVDTLLSHGITVKSLFAPEHGIRGDHGAGEKVKSGKDEKTGIPIISLYGSHRKPTPSDLKGVDIVVFDIQDVGARFYTYISTLHYVMEACAEQNIPVLVLDRPNPHGHYIDGPILDTAFKSFVGMHPVPVVHGMTVGEYAQMINEEAWLKGKVKCNLAVITMQGYQRNMRYALPVPPSPNLPNNLSVQLYPSLCFFEGTNVSVGRGTSVPFQIIGSPFLQGDFWDTTFTPVSIPHAAPNPPHLGKACIGYSYLKHDVPGFKMDSLNISWLIKAYQESEQKEKFFNSFIHQLAGGKHLAEQIKSGLTEQEIRATWQSGLKAFSKTREKYLIYP